MSSTVSKRPVRSMSDTLRSLFRIQAAPAAAPVEAAAAAVPFSLADRPRRIRAPMVCRPAGLHAFARPSRIDPRMGPLCLYSDEEVSLGERLELEVFVGDESAVFTATVARLEPLTDARPARFNVVLEVTRINAASADRLIGVLA